MPRESPTVLRVRGYRFYFYSREETRLIKEHLDEILTKWNEHLAG